MNMVINNYCKLEDNVEFIFVMLTALVYDTWPDPYSFVFVLRTFSFITSQLDFQRNALDLYFVLIVHVLISLVFCYYLNRSTFSTNDVEWPLLIKWQCTIMIGWVHVWVLKHYECNIKVLWIIPVFKLPRNELLKFT